MSDIRPGEAFLISTMRKFYGPMAAVSAAGILSIVSVDKMTMDLRASVVFFMTAIPVNLCGFILTMSGAETLPLNKKRRFLYGLLPLMTVMAGFQSMLNHIMPFSGYVFSFISLVSALIMTLERHHMDLNHSPRMKKNPTRRDQVGPSIDLQNREFSHPSSGEAQ